MILIYLYIVTRSKIVDLFAHLQYITKFTTPYVRQTNLGFILATYEHALYTLLEHTKEDLQHTNSEKMAKVIDMSICLTDNLRDTFRSDQHMRMSIVPDALNESHYDPFEEISEANLSVIREEPYK